MRSGGEARNPREKLRRFIRTALAGDAEGEPCRVLSLWHIGVQSQERAPIQSWATKDLRSDMHDAVDQLVDQIMEAAENDCESMGTDQTYALCPIFGNASTPTGRCMFPMSPPIVDNNFDSTLVATSEPPTARGQLAQTQRHLEGIHKLHVGVLAEVFRNQRMVTDQLLEMNRKMQDRIDMQDRDRLRTVQLQEELLSQKAQRELDAEMSRAKVATLMTAAEALTPMLPMALGSVLKSETISKAAPSPMEAAFKTFMSNLTDDEKMGIFGSLSEGNRTVLMMMMSALQQNKGGGGEGGGDGG